jgi:hypothetical protein
MYKELKKLNPERTNNSIKNGKKSCTDKELNSFQKKKHEWPINTQRNVHQL